ncbi:uncharacterized protein [Eurosta solidaginis]|uniref:uncharacterized protein n=1 Tax=Eurosta solidaginis TaxID=178769 RepID=UPI00353079FC
MKIVQIYFGVAIGITVVLANDVVPNPEDVLVFFTQSLRGRPAIMANGVRFLVMSENKKKILWRCSSMATKKIKCPARITMLKGTPPKFIINKAEHVHAELKRNKYGSSKQAAYHMPHATEQQEQCFSVANLVEVAHNNDNERGHNNEHVD